MNNNTNKEKITFIEYKELMLMDPSEDYFELHERELRTNERQFFAKLNKSKLFQHRHNSPKNIYDVSMSEQDWERSIERFVNYKSSTIIEQYPSTGYFECENADGKYFALLPNTYSETCESHRYRVSAHDDKGPFGDSIFKTREEALHHLASRNATMAPGAIDKLTDQANWLRGTWIIKWKDEFGSPKKGFLLNLHRFEVRELFPEFI
ncbi:hypothetical protein [Vibrio barjaei]|uniref:hypothetical protein n=1 Tax=Vibrio barjaei TaxID=1676683 RepID=UPI002284DF56|nr:hypothetical protein [Vibrio barjaei]MCY9872976.1 hypothetical protein [Vibrio barjaei]